MKPVKHRMTVGPRSRLASIVLLCLLAHAFFVSVTHHHGLSRTLSPDAIATLTADGDGGSGAEPDSGGDAHCLSCRLQRNFNSNIHTATVLVQPIEQPLCREPLLIEGCLRGSSLLILARGPPLS